MNDLYEQLVSYAEQFSEPESDLLKELYRQTHVKIYNPRMVSGHLQGRILAMLSQMIQPRYILEIGTYTGYSALCLAEGLQTDGMLHTIEIDDELEDFIRHYLNRSPYKDKIVLHIGNALDIIPTLHLTFDLIYIDGDKREYPQYLDVAIEKLRSGGYIIADNVFWNGKVIDPNQQDAFTNAIRTFNQTVHNHPQLKPVILPVRDGLSVIRKL